MAKPNGVIYSASKSLQFPKLITVSQGVNHCRQGKGYSSKLKIKSSSKEFWPLGGKLSSSIGFRGSSLVCWSTETDNAETKERVRHYDDCSNSPSSNFEGDCSIDIGESLSSIQGFSEAFRFAYNDAKFVNERARNDIILLSRGIMKLDARARQDVAFLSSEFLKLDARARENTEKIDHDVKRKAERLNYVATILKSKAQFRLKTAADKHWSDGALEADLKRADFVAKRRAMENSLLALEFVKNIHDMMVNKIYRLKRDSITLEKNGKILEFIPEDISPDRINAVQEAYWSIASALSEADGIDYTDPEELELLVSALIDLDALDGKITVSLLAECSTSPDVSTRRALANALSAAPSMWTLGNAGMGALQRLVEDSNPAIAAAAAKTLSELKKQWEIKEGDTWMFMMNQTASSEINDEDDEDDN